jgi:hypothetical protein
LNEVIGKFKREMEHRRHFMNALGNYASVIGFIEQLEAKYPDAQAEAFPEGWNDPLDLYGHYRHELDKPGVHLKQERADLQQLLDKHGPEWVWQYRLKLVAERVFIREF